MGEYFRCCDNLSEFYCPASGSWFRGLVCCTSASVRLFALFLPEKEKKKTHKTRWLRLYLFLSPSLSALPSPSLSLLVNGCISEKWEPGRWLWYPSGLSSRWTIPLPSVPPHPHADFTVFINRPQRLRPHLLLPLLTSSPPCPPLTSSPICSRLPFLPPLGLLHLLRPLGPLHFPFVLLENPSMSISPFTVILSYLPSVPSSSPRLPPSLTCCSLTLPLLWAPPPPPSPSSLLPTPSVSFCHFSQLTWCRVIWGFPAEVTIVVSDRCVCVCLCVCVCVCVASGFHSAYKLLMAQTRFQGKYVSSVTNMVYTIRPFKANLNLAHYNMFVCVCRRLCVRVTGRLCPRGSEEHREWAAITCYVSL